MIDAAEIMMVNVDEAVKHSWAESSLFPGDAGTHKLVAQPRRVIEHRDMKKEVINQWSNATATVLSP